LAKITAQRQTANPAQPKPKPNVNRQAKPKTAMPKISFGKPSS
jgi:hypothetical protein